MLEAPRTRESVDDSGKHVIGMLIGASEVHHLIEILWSMLLHICTFAIAYRAD
jgi:hypothetical protein